MPAARRGLAPAARGLSGSQVAAGDVAALLKLERGGRLRICPKTSLSVSANPSSKALALGLNTGAMELDYEVRSGVDSLLTPDFRLQMISPGAFHLAIRVGSSGDTCLRWLPGGDAAVFVTEMMGSDSYQLSPGKSVLFRAGKISGAMAAPAECGCPEKAAAVGASRERSGGSGGSAGGGSGGGKPRRRGASGSGQLVCLSRQGGGAGLLRVGIAAIVFDGQLETGAGAAAGGESCGGNQARGEKRGLPATVGRHAGAAVPEVAGFKALLGASGLCCNVFC